MIGVAPQGGSFEIIRIRSDTLHAEIQPAFGGRIIGLFDLLDADRTDWLVPARPASIDDGSHVKGGCFPMMPYCNRIAGGRFAFAGHDYNVGAGHSWDGACHGHGFLRAWGAEEVTRDSAVISYEYGAPDWPSRYRARQRFRLDDRMLEVSLSLENIGTGPMPAGFGLHPYFPRRQNLLFTIGARGHRPILPDFLVAEEEPSPFANRELCPAAAFSPGDAYCLSGWPGTAQLRWPDERRHLEVRASPALAACVLFAPVESDAFCLEPSSHVIAAINTPDVPGDSGLRILQAGELLAASVTFACGFDTI